MEWDEREDEMIMAKAKEEAPRRVFLSFFSFFFVSFSLVSAHLISSEFGTENLFVPLI